MSHNTPIDNARFKLTWNETGLRYLLGDEPRDEAKIARVQEWIAEVRAEISALEAATPGTST